jgi:hypothetical protein
MRKAKFIHLPDDEPHETEVIDGIETVGPRDLLNELKTAMDRQRAAVDLARPALARLVQVMTHRTGQGYKLRSLLYSMWNGLPTTVNDVCGLDYELRQDLGAVILAWGFGRGDWEFFYDSMKAAVSAAGLWEWFLEAGEGRCRECGREH